MSDIVNIENLFHRSRARIKDLGEVFTPESYVDEMLDLLGRDKRGLWADESIIFFEPCCGHGNIVLPIFKRRLEAIYKKASASDVKDPALYAVANAINSLWAIDLDKKNVENCQSRVLSAALEFLKEKLNFKVEAVFISQKKDYFTHLLAAIKWHIDENETLSALSEPSRAKLKANQTRSGAKWFNYNGHRQIDFELTWVEFYRQCKAGKSIPLEFERSAQFVSALLAGKIRGYDEYDFAKGILQPINQPVAKRKSGQLNLGA